MRTGILFTAAAVLGVLSPGLHASGAAAGASAGVTCRIDRPAPLSLAELTRAAGTVVLGRVTGVKVASHPRYPRLTVTHVTVNVADTWKGRPGRSITFTQFGDASVAGAHPEREVIDRLPGLPAYREGEEILLFLRTPSRAGLTSPVGGATGKLEVHREPGTGKARVQGVVADRFANHAAGSRDEWVLLQTVRARVLGAVRREGRSR